MKKQRTYLTYKHVELGLITLAFRSTKSLNKFLEHHNDDILYVVKITKERPIVKYERKLRANAVNLLEDIVLHMKEGDEVEYV